ncbi:MAG: hypothetical protein U0T74_00275 [Chitinophagales bacterium]
MSRQRCASGVSGTLSICNGSIDQFNGSETLNRGAMEVVYGQLRRNFDRQPGP